MACVACVRPTSAVGTNAPTATSRGCMLHVSQHICVKLGATTCQCRPFSRCAATGGPPAAVAPCQPPHQPFVRSGKCQTWVCTLCWTLSAASSQPVRPRTCAGSTAWLEQKWCRAHTTNSDKKVLRRRSREQQTVQVDSCLGKCVAARAACPTIRYSTVCGVRTHFLPTLFVSARNCGNISWHLTHQVVPNSTTAVPGLLSDRKAARSSSLRRPFMLPVSWLGSGSGTGDGCSFCRGWGVYGDRGAVCQHEPVW